MARPPSLGAPASLSSGIQATSVPAGPFPPPEGVLRPKLAWRILVWFVCLPVLIAAPFQALNGDWPWEPWQKGVFFLVNLYMTLAAFRQKVVIQGDALAKHGALVACSPIRAADMTGFTVHQHRIGRGGGGRVTVLMIYASGGTIRGFRLGWWDRWQLIIEWLTAHRTEFHEGMPHWTVPTDLETASRVAPVLERQPRLHR